MLQHWKVEAGQSNGGREVPVRFRLDPLTVNDGHFLIVMVIVKKAVTQDGPGLRPYFYRGDYFGQ